MTEGAGLLIATVRTMVRDAIATVVSRLMVYAGELAASLGAATPLVIEQVSTLCASWAAKIARWLRQLLSSLRRLGSAMDELGAAIATLRRAEASDMGTRRERRASNAAPGKHPVPPSRVPHDWLPAGDPVYHAANRTAIGYDSATMLNFDTARPKPGYHDVVVHGQPDGHFRPGLVGADGQDYRANVTHAGQIADAIRSNPGWGGGPVRLISCHSGRVVPGADVPPAAQQVADALGVPVLAPTQTVGVYLEGDADRAVHIFNNGKWKLFEPGGGT